jgi:hypothetical protein
VKRVRPTQVQIGDLLGRGYRGVMRVSAIEVREGMVRFYDSNGNFWCHKVTGWATIKTALDAPHDANA